MEKHNQFKVGDRVIIKGKPSFWSSHLNNNNPVDGPDIIIYPYKCTIKELKEIKTELSYDYIAMTCGNYGWDLTHLIKKGLIEKEQNMERKIIGYKLIKPEYEEAAKKLCDKGVNWRKNDKFHLSVIENISIPNLKKAGVLDLWFEPVYEHRFEIGEWVTLKKNSDLRNYPEVYTTQIQGFDKDGWIESNINRPLGGHFNYIHYRKATPEEIEKAQEIKIQGYKVEFNQIDGSIQIGCKFFDYEDVQSVIKAIDAGLSIDSKEREAIKKIWNKIK